MVSLNAPRKATRRTQARRSRPVWELAELLPPQGDWAEDDYLALTAILEPHPILELADGCVEVLPMPTEWHQFILQFFYELLGGYVRARAPGAVLVSGMRIRIRKGRGKGFRYRGPDVMYMKKEHAQRRHEKFWDGADLVAEVVSGSAEDRDRDYVTKRREYAQTGIPEYWIIDREKRLVRVLTLRGKSYRVHGNFGPGQSASGTLLPGFVVPVDELLAAGDEE